MERMNEAGRGPLLSIIVTVYDSEPFFKRCMESLLTQSYKNVEIIVVNDGSSGNIEEIMASYCRNDRVKFIDNQENLGLLRARVLGSRKAKGKYIAFADSDDYVSFDFYRALIYRAEETEADIVIGKTVWEKEGERFVYNYHDSCFHFQKLEGEKARKIYFSQETQCYSWHTIWNKIYKKSLWNRCLAEFETVNRHIVMTEDVYFSSILFFYTGRVAVVNNDAYFYCIHENAATDAEKITLSRFVKDVSDIKYIFDKVDEFLREKGAEKELSDGMKRGRAHYARMWENLAENTFSDEEKEKARLCVQSLCVNVGSQNVEDDYFFESVKTPWKGGLEYIKQELAGAKEKVISFDIFDTLIQRPFYEPEDLFRLMDRDFSEQTGNHLLFSKLRTEGEKLAREYYQRQKNLCEITLDEIYDFIGRHYNLSHKITKRMEELEKKLEIRFCKARKSGRELLELAEYLGKSVILISDMYLDRETLLIILEKNGIRGFDKLYISSEERCLKYDGSLYRRIMGKMGERADNIIHIGDTWTSDVEGAAAAGIKNIFFPKAREVFENKIEGCRTNRCAEIGRTICGGWIDYDQVKTQMGFRCMQALALNSYFDNPYRNFQSDSDFNGDPYFMGFYLLGMHLMGIVKWMDESRKGEEKRPLVFLARDGFLPMKAYEKWRNFSPHPREIKYVQASRRLLLPVMVQEKINFYQLPIEYRAHSPHTLTKLLSFAAGEKDEDEWSRVLEENGIKEYEKFSSIEEFHNFIRLFIECRYDEKKHRKEQALVKEYYSREIGDGVTFDLGYSGRIQSAICEAVGHPVDTYFIHEDQDLSVRLKEYSQFQITDFYNFYPIVTGPVREYIFSDTAAAVLSLKKQNGKIFPVFDEEEHSFPDRYIVSALQEGGCDMVEAFTNTFGDYLSEVNYSPQEVSLPFEGFLRYPSTADLHIFSASSFEDFVFGARKKINMEEYIRKDLKEKGGEWADPIVRASGETEDKDLLDCINRSSKMRRGLAWFVLDGKLFKEKLKINLKKFFKILKG